MSTSTSQTGLTPAGRKYRLGMPFWIWILLLAGGGVAAIQTLVADQGVANGFTWPLLVLAGLLCLAWFTLFSGYSSTARWGVCAVAVLLGIAFAIFVRVEGLYGNIIPILAWRTTPRPIDLEPAAPSSDNGATPRVDLFTTTPHDFPQFLGPKRNLSVPNVKLLRDWTANPPKELWRQPIGPGWSGFAIVNGFAVTLEQRKPTELVTCYEVATGKLLWSHGTETRYDTWIGGVGPRSTPTIYQGRVYALGATGRLHCLEGATGQSVWSKDLLKEFGLTYEQELDQVLYGRSNSPLIVEDLVIVPAGGPKDGPRWSLAAFHQDNGALVWKAGDHNVSYSSPALATIHGVLQIVCVSEDEVSGHEIKTGKVLWKMPWPGITSKDANVSQAVPVPPDRVFLSKGYGMGASLLEFGKNADGSFEPRKVYHEYRHMKTKFTNVTIKDGHVYGLSDGILECMELETGKRIWREGRYGHGQIVRADDLILVLSEEGDLVLVEATPERPDNVLGKIQALEGRTWNNLALAGPHLLVRNAREAVCYRLAVEEPNATK